MDSPQAGRRDENFVDLGVTQSGLILTSNPGLREDMAQLEHGQAKLEGLLEGLREAITVRTASS